LNPNLEWEWTNHPVTDLVKPHIEKVAFLFQKVTRIKINVPPVGKKVGPHRDFLTGEIYGNTVRAYYENVLDFNTWEIFYSPKKEKAYYPTNMEEAKRQETILPFRQEGLHKKQNYYSLRYPLTLGPSQGKPFIYRIGEDRKTYFDTQNKAYFLNDVIIHGADPVPFLRGIIWVDGIIKMETLPYFTNPRFYY